MANFIFIFVNILSPIFILIGLGFLLRKKFELSVQTLTKVQMYILIPALLFKSIYESTINGEDVMVLFGFTVLLFFVLTILSTIVAKLLKLSRRKEKAFINSVALRNQGNFGIPLIALAFAGSGSEQALSLHIIVMLTTNLLLNTFGLYNASAGSYTGKEAIKNILRLPMIWAICLAIIVKLLHVQVPGPFMDTMDIMGRSMVAVALTTLGIQLASTVVNFKDITIYISNTMRLILSPIIAWLMVMVFGIEGMMAQVLILGAAAPTAVNSVLMAIEFGGDDSYASETVFTSTIFSAITVAIVVGMVM